MENFNLNTKVHEETKKVAIAMKHLSLLWTTPEVIRSKYPELWGALLDIAVSVEIEGEQNGR
jgi:hypothetical protein